MSRLAKVYHAYLVNWLLAADHIDTQRALLCCQLVLLLLLILLLSLQWRLLLLLLLHREVC